MKTRVLYWVGALLLLGGVVLMCWTPGEDDDDDQGGRDPAPRTPPQPAVKLGASKRFSFPIEESSN